MMDFRYFLCVCSLQLAIVQCVTLQCSPPRAVIENGNVTGIRLYYENIPVNAFYGIQYDKPPTGSRRFKPPVRAPLGNGILHATRKPPACFQVHNILEARYVDQTSPESEDCLYLNIWSPATVDPKQKKAVMVWIHGGNFTYGSSSMLLYDGLVLSAMGDVIVVNMNYRLGMLSFLTADNGDAFGNAAMYDQLDALKWISRNIDAFGGDSSRITLFGQSAGSLAVSIHALSLFSKNFFHRIIMQSGSTAYLAAENARRNFEISDKVSRAMGCANDSVNIKNQPDPVVACLRRSDPRTLTENSVYLLLPEILSYSDPFSSKTARKAIINGEFKNCDLLIGNTGDEGSYLVNDAFPDLFGINGQNNQHPTLSKAEGRTMLITVLMGFALDANLSSAVADYYLGKVEGDNNEEVLRQVYTAVGDYALLCPTVYTAETSAKQGNRVFYYEFDHRPRNTERAEWMGVAHFEEIQFVFGLPFQLPRNYTEVERQLSRRMIQLWTSFAKTGSPLSGLEQTWPLYSRENRIYKVLNTTDGYLGAYGPNADNCDFFRSMFGF